MKQETTEEDARKFLDLWEENLSRLARDDIEQPNTEKKPAK